MCWCVQTAKRGFSSTRPLVRAFRNSSPNKPLCFLTTRSTHIPMDNTWSTHRHSQNKQAPCAIMGIRGSSCVINSVGLDLEHGPREAILLFPQHMNTRHIQHTHTQTHSAYRVSRSGLILSKIVLQRRSQPGKVSSSPKRTHKTHTHTTPQMIVAQTKPREKCLFKAEAQSELGL